MKAFIAATAALLSAHAQEFRPTDRYPEIRALIREAEDAAAGIRRLSDGNNPNGWAARLYARAGYLDDAVRAIGKTEAPASGQHYDFWPARVLYGDLTGCEKSLQAITDPERKATALASLANLLWRMGEPDKARIQFEAAKQIVPKIVNPDHRKRILMEIAQGFQYLSEEPPFRVTATPNPQKRSMHRIRQFHPFQSPQTDFETGARLKSRFTRTRTASS